MRIQSNITAMNTHRKYTINNKALAKAAEKLSSGYRINRAGDDAAGLAISEKMRAQVRGLNMASKNSDDAVSLVRTAEGALQEVHSMLQRMNELAVQSASGTNDTAVDRAAMQQEFQNLQDEIDQIAATTTFNDMPLLDGGMGGITAGGTIGGASVIAPGDVPFEDYTILDADLGDMPFTDVSSPNELQLQAIVNNPSSPLYGKTFNLLFGSGSTSHSSFRITHADNSTEVLPLSSGNLAVSDVTIDPDNGLFQRTMTYGSETESTFLKVIQTVRLGGSDDHKYYDISYSATVGSDIKDVEFMFHADTAYNNDDYCEEYYIDGQRVENFCVYSASGSQLTDGSSSDHIHTGVPESFSIVDADDALSFTEKISFAGTKPDSLSIGFYGNIYDWGYYEADALPGQLGQTALDRDLGFSLYYDLDPTQNMEFSFRYGIASTKTDPNIKNVPVKPNQTIDPGDYGLGGKDFIIQVGAEEGQTLTIHIDAMNTIGLGIPRGTIHIATQSSASRAITATRNAINLVSAQRADLGAMHNRLEHKIQNLDNTAENLSAAESRIRDVDMAKEMTEFTKQNILSQAATAMLAQANALPQGVLSLLQ